MSPPSSSSIRSSSSSSSNNHNNVSWMELDSMCQVGVDLLEKKTSDDEQEYNTNALDALVLQIRNQIKVVQKEATTTTTTKTKTNLSKENERKQMYMDKVTNDFARELDAIRKEGLNEACVQIILVGILQQGFHSWTEEEKSILLPKKYLPKTE